MQQILFWMNVSPTHLQFQGIVTLPICTTNVHFQQYDTSKKFNFQEIDISTIMTLPNIYNFKEWGFNKSDTSKICNSRNLTSLNSKRLPKICTLKESHKSQLLWHFKTFALLRNQVSTKVIFPKICTFKEFQDPNNSNKFQQINTFKEFEGFNKFTRSRFTEFDKSQQTCTSKELHTFKVQRIDKCQQLWPFQKYASSRNLTKLNT